MFNKNYHQDPSILHIGCEEPHAYLIPYQSTSVALEDKRENSDYFKSLCGEWDFRFYTSPFYVEDQDGALPESESWDKLQVPMSWQMTMTRGYDLPFYDDTNFPFPVNPPFVPTKNPCGLYRNYFEIEKNTIEDKDTYLVFEGVDSCFYLYINRQFVGYSQVSHSTSEFLITPYLKEGKNEIRVLVLKWCDGSYLEDQDKIRLSGIFREVYLLNREHTHVRDLYVRASVDEDLKKAEISAQIELVGNEHIKYELVDPDGKSYTSGDLQSENGLASFTAEVDSPLLWSDETPLLYKLLISCGKEHFCQPIGIRRIEIKGRVVLINGKAVKLKGINRHDSSPETGAAITYEHMLRDLYIFKSNNINTVRTAHYPNDPRFLGMCDRLGFYVCDEADVESHGMDFAEGYGRNSLSDDPLWTEAYVDRGRRMMEQDKNHACVIMWSVGNESGIGQNLRKIADYFHTRMPGCIVHSERYNYIEYLLSINNPEVEGFERYLTDPYIDIDSRMYASPEDSLHKYVEDSTRVRPYFLCEFCHAMGNGPGDLAAYWKLIWENDCFLGGCVWEFCDHAVNVGTVEDPKYLYGGDFGEIPNGKNFCTDGLVFPDRRLHSGMLEYKQVIRPCILTSFDEKTGRIELFNRRYFTKLTDLDLYWTVEVNGKVIKDGYINALDVSPQEKKCYTLEIEDLSLDSEFCYLNLYFRTNSDLPWAQKGHEVGKEQIRLSSTKPTLNKESTSSASLKVTETNEEFLIVDGDTKYRIDRFEGTVRQISLLGKEFLSAPVEFNLWRAPTDNDRNIRLEWEKRGYDRIWIDVRSCELESSCDTEVTITASLVICATSLSAIADVKAKYTVTSGKGISLSYSVSMRNEPTVSLPRVGVQFNMPEGFEGLRYFGKGPTGSYQDKQLAAAVGLYSDTVSDHFEHYIKPQENLAHCDTVWAEISADNAKLLILRSNDTPSFSFNCSHYTPKSLTLTDHDHELESLKETVVNIDYMQCGIGSNSCGPVLDEQYTLKAQKYDYSFRLLATDKLKSDPFESIQ